MVHRRKCWLNGITKDEIVLSVAVPHRLFHNVLTLDAESPHLLQRSLLIVTIRV